MTGSGDGDRSLVEDAVKLLLASAPTGWTRLHAEFEPSSQPPVAQARVTVRTEEVPLAVPPEAVALIAEYQHRAAAASPPRRIVIECDSTGALSMRTGPVVESASRSRITLWLWGLAALASIAVLIVAVLGADRSEGPTLRPAAVTDSMTDAQAREAADTTVRAWVRERNAGHLANLEALTCPDSEGTVTDELNAVRRHERMPAMQVVSTGAFGRQGSLWALSTHFSNDKSVQFVLGVRRGELLVCRIAAAPVP
ncbi:hypothetical protein [Mycobacterium asiaticum]|uniref:Uncharacterized protein n=1 Tax=Mycobacterium asiaticum TaxID=1790 RepID=A0A1A3MUD9_MYCAS|nr:hypothetical protein [Mycobacterium asiaticum]OBK12695.1 hypothetical protein A5636_11925 [Mycobacterium asiaticum]